MPRPQRVIKTFDATAMVTGNMIGSGIFLLSGYAAASVANEATLILAWVGGGIMALLGAFSIAELSTKFPETGGDFLYLHKAYGRFPAFLYGWMSLVIFETGSIAILAIFSAKYLLSLFPESTAINISEPAVASMLVLTITTMHCLRVTVGSRFQSVLTVAKIMGLAVMVFLLFGGEDGNITPAATDETSYSPFTGFSRALIPIFFAYTGWNVVGYIGGEIHNPRKTLPKALIGGTVITTVIYVLVSFAFLSALGLNAMRGEAMVPLLALKAVGAGHYGTFLTILIFVSVTGSLSITTQTAGARVIQAMGEHGIFFRVTGRLHSRFGTPVNALLVQALWAVVLIYSLDIESLVDSATVVMILFSALSISTLLKINYGKGRIKGDSNAYRTPLFPLVPLAYLISALFISWGVIRFHLSQGSFLPLWGFGFLVLGSLVYFIWQKRLGKSNLMP